MPGVGKPDIAASIIGLVSSRRGHQSSPFGA
jgi:hypothetical protein